MICLRNNLDRSVETIDLQEFRKLVGVPPDAYERGDNLMHFVIRPALMEVNGLSDIGVDIK
jgi:replication initiator protein